MQILLKSRLHISVTENLKVIQQNGYNFFLNQRTQISPSDFTHRHYYVVFTLFFSVIISSAFKNALFTLAFTKRPILNIEKLIYTNYLQKQIPDKPGKLALCIPIYGAILDQCTRNRANTGSMFMVCRVNNYILIYSR